MNEEQNQFTREAWQKNAAGWDEKMGTEGNDFFKQLQFPTILEYMGFSTGLPLLSKKVLDIACGNGILARKLAKLGCKVTAFDFSSNLIDLARGYGEVGIEYKVLDATSEQDLGSLEPAIYDVAVCNMALFDIADIDPLFSALPRILRPGGCFIFSLLHPAFNNSSTIKMVEEYEQDGKLINKYSLKIDRYLGQYSSLGLALSNQEHPQYYFNRPLQYYFQLGFKNGFIIDKFNENSLEHADTKRALSWGGNFAEIPPVCLVRMRLDG